MQHCQSEDKWFKKATNYCCPSLPPYPLLCCHQQNVVSTVLQNHCTKADSQLLTTNMVTTVHFAYFTFHASLCFLTIHVTELCLGKGALPVSSESVGSSWLGLWSMAEASYRPQNAEYT